MRGGRHCRSAEHSSIGWRTGRAVKLLLDHGRERGSIVIATENEDAALLGPLASQSPLPVAPPISEPRSAVLRQNVIDTVWVCECEILTADTARIDAVYRNDDAPRVREGELTYRLLESSDGKRTVEGIVIGQRGSVGLTENDPRSTTYRVVNPRHIFDYGRAPGPDDSHDKAGGSP